MLLFLMGFTNEWDNLGRFEFEEEKAKKEARERLRSIRKVVHSQVLDAKESPNSTLMNQMAKRLLRLTLGALLVEETEALGPSSDAQCYVVAEQSELDSFHPVHRGSGADWLGAHPDEVDRHPLSEGGSVEECHGVDEGEDDGRSPT